VVLRSGYVFIIEDELTIRYNYNIKTIAIWRMVILNLERAKEKFGVREPFYKNELKDFLKIENQNTFNQLLSNMNKFNVVKKMENGIYYFPSANERFKELKPSVSSVVNLKYLKNYNGIRTGAFLAYKYKLTSQVSGYYEIITNNVSEHTRAKKEYDGKVIVSSSKFNIDKNNYLYAEFLELVKNMNYSDYDYKKTLNLIIEVFKEMNLDIQKTKKLAKNYRGSVYASYLRKVQDILNEITSK
jgi:hypothetical protein